MTNPLQRYYRKPKIFISLPSKGHFYPHGTFSANPLSVPIYGMTGADEIAIKTPDALFNGEATVGLIESCCPAIQSANDMPVIDLEALLVGIRIASNGNTMQVSHECPACKEQNEYDFNLTSVLDHYSELEFENQIVINETTTVFIRPLTYSELSQFGTENFKIQKKLIQIKELPEDEQREMFSDIYKEIANLQFELLLKSIESVSVPEGVVIEPAFIKEWIKNSEKEVYDRIKSGIEKNKIKWEMPTFDVKCSDPECQAENKISITLDYSSFFA